MRALQQKTDARYKTLDFLIFPEEAEVHILKCEKLRGAAAPKKRPRVKIKKFKPTLKITKSNPTKIENLENQPSEKSGGRRKIQERFDQLSSS